MGPPDILSLLIADIYEAAGQLRRSGEVIAAAEGQTQARWQVLSVVSDPPLSVAQAGRRLGVSRQSVQRIANDLVDEDLAGFAPNPDHKSSPLLTLTPKGHRVLQRITTRAHEFHQDLELPLSAKDLAATCQSLQILTERVAHVE